MTSASLEISNKIEMIQLFLESLEDYVTSIEIQGTENTSPKAMQQ